MRPEFTFTNISGSVQTEFGPQEMRDPLLLPNTNVQEDNVIFFNNKGPVLQIPVPRRKTVTAKFYGNIAFGKLKKIYRICCPKTGLKHLRLLHDNAPVHKARIVAEFVFGIGEG